jgi:hypothetical protein
VVVVPVYSFLILQSVYKHPFRLVGFRQLSQTFDVIRLVIQSCRYYQSFVGVLSSIR